MKKFEDHHLNDAPSDSVRSVAELILEIETLAVFPDVWQQKFEAIFPAMLKKNKANPRQFSIVFFHGMYARELNNVNPSKFRKMWKAAEEKIAFNERFQGVNNA